MKRLAGCLVVLLCAVQAGCGSTPTQPTPDDGCVVTAASPAAGTALQAGALATIVLTGRCTANDAARANVLMGGVAMPGGESFPGVRIDIPRGTTTVTMTLTIAVPASATSVHMLMGLGYDGTVGYITGLDVTYPVN